jgi:subtilisin family serine protease
MFEDGMTAEEFVELTGAVPHALEGLVGDATAMMVIELEEPSVAEKVAQQREAGFGTMSMSRMNAYANKLTFMQNQVMDRLAKLRVDTFIGRYTYAYNGLMARVPLKQLNEIRALPYVKSVHRAPVHEPALGASVDLIGAYDVWEDTGYTGDGVTIAVIDTGIDYTHAAFGGSGDPNDYTNNDPDSIETGTFPTAKVVGGYDFVGTDYDASGSGAETVPQPDLDPLDEQSHGTHVASIAAGIAAGDVMTGVAPGASLIALKVFGESGSTNVTINALEWATMNYLMYGEPDVINMSLGSPFGTDSEDDPSVAASNNASDVGIVVVASAGNSGDTSYITGSPGSADGAISVAASETGQSVLDGFEVVTPTTLEGVHPGLQSVYYNWSSSDLPITGTLVYPEVGDDPQANQRTGCYTFNVTNTQMITGNIVLLDWTDPSCGGSVQRTGNAVAAGATGVLIADDSEIFDLYIAGSDVVPAYSIPKPIGTALKTAIQNGEVEVVMTAEHEGSVPYFEPEAVNMIASFSSRGPRGFDSFLKPDVTAPGGSIFAADMGSGDGGVSKGGTSMAAPHVAGLAALMVEAAAGRSEAVSIPQMTKAAMMNTATDLTEGMQIPRQGAGRVNAVEAVSAVDAAGGVNTLAFADPTLVTANWGVVPTSNDQKVMTTTITVWSDYPGTLTYTVSADLAVNAMISDTKMTITDTTMITDAVMVDVAPTQVVLDASGGAVVDTVVLTLTVDATKFPADFRWLEEVYGYVDMMPTDTMANEMRVPFYALPRPYTKFTDIETNTSMANPAIGEVTAVLTQTGPISSSLWAYPALVYDANEAGQMDHGDIRMMGANYDPVYQTLDIAINSYGHWHTPQPYIAEFDLYLDVDEDGTDDFVDFNWNLGGVSGVDDTDEWYVIQVDLSNGMLYLASPYLIYTDYNANLMEWYLAPAWNGLDATANPNFDYELMSFDYWGNVDGTMPGRFDFAVPPLMATFSGVPGPNNPRLETTSYIYDMASYLYSQPVGSMLVDYKGDPRGAATDRYQALFFAGPVPATVYLPVVMR